MTTLDGIVLAAAVAQGVAVVVLGITGYLFYASYRNGRRKAQPLMDRAAAVSGAGKAVVDRARKDGMASARRVKAVIQAVKRRAATPVRIAREIRPAAAAAAADLVERRATAEARSHRLAALARGIGRVGHAARQAGRAARGEPPADPEAG